MYLVKHLKIYILVMNHPISFYQERMKTITYLEQQFENPIHTHGFNDRVSRHKIVLEQASKSIK